MKKNLKNLFTEDVQGVLTEDTLTAIEKAFEEKVQLTLEAALEEQDTIYADKLKVLLETLDKDRTNKMKKLVGIIDKNNAAKLVKLVRLYERAEKVDGKKFKTQLITTISSYLDEFLHEALDKKDLETAVKNKTAFRVLENMRNVLGVDVALMNPAFQAAVVDGKAQITELQKENTELKQQFKELYETNQKAEVAMILENKTAKLPEAQKNFIKKTLGSKSPSFIEENFDYTLRLFNKQEKSKLETLKEEALNKRTVKPDFVPQQKVVVEKVNNNELQTEYLNVLSKGRGIK